MKLVSEHNIYDHRYMLAGNAVISDQPG